MHVKKIKKPIGKTGYPVGYPVSGNLRISGRISESGFSKPGYPVSGFKISIRYNPSWFFAELKLLKSDKHKFRDSIIIHQRRITAKGNSLGVEF